MSHHGNEIHLEQKYENLLNELDLMKKKYIKKLDELEELEIYLKYNITGAKNDTN
tara:strand:- start:39 stop:203 length:165 start_codon:yes stop_codon:yes gene_type:complete